MTSASRVFRLETRFGSISRPVSPTVSPIFRRVLRPQTLKELGAETGIRTQTTALPRRCTTVILSLLSKLGASPWNRTTTSALRGRRHTTRPAMLRNARESPTLFLPSGAGDVSCSRCWVHAPDFSVARTSRLRFAMSRRTSYRGAVCGSRTRAPTLARLSSTVKLTPLKNGCGCGNRTRPLACL